MVDRVEIDIIDEKQPTWLAFLNGEHDWVELPDGFCPWPCPAAAGAQPGARGIRAERGGAAQHLLHDVQHGAPGGGRLHARARGAAPRHRAGHRRASARSALLRHGAAVPAQSPVAVHLSGFHPDWKSEMSEYDPAARARCSSCTAGATATATAGASSPTAGRWCWRSPPSPTRPAAISTSCGRRTSAIGLRIEFKPAKWPENLKAGRAGKLQIWALASLAAGPTGRTSSAATTARRPGCRTSRASSTPSSIACTSACRACPTAPSGWRCSSRSSAGGGLHALQAGRAPLRGRPDDPRWSASAAGMFWLNWYHMVDVVPGGDSPA
jgi:hypothetical protein